MSPTTPRPLANPQRHTWEQFKRAMRQVDRDSLLVQASAASSKISRGEQSDDLWSLGLTPWNIADVARTALAWGKFQKQPADWKTLLQLCNMNVNLVDEDVKTNPSTDALGRVFARLFFQQFPGQHDLSVEVARTMLLFGSTAEHPPGFKPRTMTSGWFEKVTKGLTIDEYIQSIFLVFVVAERRNGGFSIEWLDSPEFAELEDMISMDVVRRAFTKHLLTTVDEFKATNRTFQDPLPDVQKQFAFNPLADKPFIERIDNVPIAPWVQAIIAKALPPSVYHLARRDLGDGFTHDLGAVFQHYTGRQLALVRGGRQVIREFRYGTSSRPIDSCDWFLDLPGVLVLVECKARQPTESLRTGGTEWLNSVADSIGKGIRQLNRSARDIANRHLANETIDASKPLVGLVVTLEPFYLNQNAFIWDKLPKAEFPIGVLSIGELESLVLLSADELEKELRAAADSSPQRHVMLLAQALASASGRENQLLVATWDSIPLVGQAGSAVERLNK